MRNGGAAQHIIERRKNDVSAMTKKLRKSQILYDMNILRRFMNCAPLPSFLISHF